MRLLGNNNRVQKGFGSRPSGLGHSAIVRVLVLSTLLAGSSSALAWNTAGGTVKSIWVYAGTDTILVDLSNNGIAVPECSNTTLFAINGTRSESRRSQMLSLLLTAKATGTNINLSYRKSGGCVPFDSNNSAYREIVRIVF